MNKPFPPIETQGLSKKYSGKEAVRDLTLTVEQGEVFGFLGPNGAGKTTSVKMLLGLVSPTNGEGRLYGASLSDPHIRTRIGFLPEHFRFHDWLKAREFLLLHADLYRMPRERSRYRIHELLELVGLSDHIDKKLSEFSKGMLQRIGLAQSLLNNPDLVILDEPTSGLDPVGRRLVRDIIRDLQKHGKTIFLNSHFLSEVEVTCDRVAFIKNGEVIRIDLINTLVDDELVFEIKVQNMTQESFTDLSRLCSKVEVDNEKLIVKTREGVGIADVNQFLVNRGAKVFSLIPKHVSLEEMFIQIIGIEDSL